MSAGKTMAPPSSQAAEGVRQALNIPDPIERAARLASTLEGLGPDVAAEVVAVIEPRLTDTSWVDTGLVLQWWVVYQPMEAIAWVAENLPDRAQALQGIMVSALAYRDFEAATALVEAQRFSPIIDRLRAGLIRGGYDAGRPELLDYLIGLGRGFQRQAMIHVLAKRIANREGPDAAMEWALALPDKYPRFKLQAFRRVGKALTGVDSEAARRWAEEQRFAEYGDGVLEMVSRNDAKRNDPASTFEWLSTLPDGPDLSDAGREVFFAWIKEDNEAARAWLNSVSDGGSWLDGARVSQVAWVVSTQGPDVAFEWVDRIHDERMRAEAVQLLLGRWLKIDPAAAEAWIEQADLDDHQRQMLERAALQRRNAAQR